MELFKSVGYTDIKIPCLDKNIVDILTSKERSCIDIGYFDESFKKQRSRFFSVNYGLIKGDGSPVLRGFEFEKVLYEIDSERKQLIMQQSFGDIFHDMDKIPPKNSYVFEGEPHEFILGFMRKNYSLIGK